ncbi:HCNGP-like protein-domain-containing protein [Xylariales sp. AK1849]|nr:HCNGP-like protein-domain-containing protein [Xylariales sp. AK1849]
MGLVGYESSDDDADVQATPATEPPKPNSDAAFESNGESSATQPKPKAPTIATSEQSHIIGPMPLPGESSIPSFPPLEDLPMDYEAPAPPPGSPYSATRALLRDLTLPTVPNMEIPPSPPGSPPPGTNKKFEQFLELKKKGVHFNSKIAQSSALKNPGLMDKLLNFVEISQKDQYKTTLTTDLWDPNGYSKSAYKEHLRQSQADISLGKARTKGGPVEFVAASGGTSRDTTPSGVQVTAAPSAGTGKRKTRFDI